MTDWSAFPTHIAQRMREHPALCSPRHQPRLFCDTSDFGNIDYGDVIHVAERYFLVAGYMKEGRFGIEEQPKQWVPRVYDLESGNRYILKLVFHETYTMQLGDLQVTCYRNPDKEARVLEVCTGNHTFMQGQSFHDQAGNTIRLLDIVNGSRLDKKIHRLGTDHLDFIENHVHTLLCRFLRAVEGIRFLHQHGLKHGDIRRDHIFVDRNDGHFCWIDFDYDFHLPERPFALDLLGLGSVLLFLLGRETFRLAALQHDKRFTPQIANSISPDDLALLFQDRIFNLKKIYPYIPRSLNDILLHFSMGTGVMYDLVDEFYDDLSRAIESVWGTTTDTA